MSLFFPLRQAVAPLAYIPNLPLLHLQFNWQKHDKYIVVHG
jgi:hypothetical protein